jgi:hypothetical protein
MRSNLCKGVACVVAAIVLSAAVAAQAAECACKAAEPFNGMCLAGWKTKKAGDTAAWCVGTAKPDAADPSRFTVSTEGHELINNTTGHGKSLDLYTADTYGDALITLEVMVPKGSNSGVYVMGEYEVQVLDSFGHDANPGPGDMGAIYGAQPPKNPKYKAPGEWNTYEIYWQAPKFNDKGEKTANGKFIKVILNGVVIHENLEMTKATPGGVDGKEKAKGPLMFQGNHGPVSYRNIKIAPLP